MRHLVWLQVLFISVGLGQDDSRRIVPAFGGRKLALVIGNKSYTWKPLVNPVNDANAVAGALRDVGFAAPDVHLLLDATQTDLRRGIREFVESVKPGDLAFVYYSGHGVEVKGNNYLLPVDLPQGASENYVQDEAVSAQRILRDLADQGARVRVLILDACRDNPLRAAKSTSGGLAPMEGRGSLIVFATEAGRTAGDTPGSANSVFTRRLVEGLHTPGLPLDEAMKRVSRNVARDTAEHQIPAIYGLMLEDVVLVPGSASTETARSTYDAAGEAWARVKDSQNPEDFDAFATAFPDSALASTATFLATQLRKKISPLVNSRVEEQNKGKANSKEGFANVRVNPKDGLTYVWIPSGRFVMGCSPRDNECADDEKNTRQVTIPKGFWMSETDVTQQAYETVTGKNPSHFKGSQLPVETVSWDEAQSYCVSTGGRLPTQAEWEYAARGGLPDARYGDLNTIAWYDKNSGGTTHEVKTKRPNAYGLYDMLGNVWQWTADGYDVNKYRSLRGGSWFVSPRFLRASVRYGSLPTYRDDNIGFRCVGD